MRAKKKKKGENAALEKWTQDSSESKRPLYLQGTHTFIFWGAPAPWGGGGGGGVQSRKNLVLIFIYL